jgi:hypothetical protein
MPDRIAYLTAIQEQVIAIRQLAREERAPHMVAHLDRLADALEQRVRAEDLALCSPE